MAKGFWRGIIAGGLAGGLLSSWLARPVKKMNGEDLQDQMGRLRIQAKRAMNEAKDGMKGIYRKK